MREKEKPEQLVQSVDRSLNIIERVVQERNDIGVTELSNSLGLHKSTTHRLLSTLVYRGYLKKNNKNNKYNIGHKLYEIGSLAIDNIEVCREAKPFLKELMNITRETIHLGVFNDLEVIYIDKIESTQTIRMHSHIGKKVPAHCTSLGKVLMAFSTNKKVNQIIAEKGLKSYTENTITDLDFFKENLNKIKDLGYGIDNIEHEEGIRCIAAPIFDHSGNIIAAFSISGPIMRVTHKKIRNYIPVIKEYSMKISRVMGYKDKD